MDGSDKKFTINSHDFITRAYFKHYLKTTPGKFLTKEDLLEPVISKYVYIRFKRNAILAIFAFFYTGQPLFRPY